MTSTRLASTWVCGAAFKRAPDYHCAMAQYIYTMNRVSKVVPPKRTILRDISLSFFPGAKIGVLASTAPASPRC